MSARRARRVSAAAALAPQATLSALRGASIARTIRTTAACADMRARRATRVSAAPALAQQATLSALRGASTSRTTPTTAARAGLPARRDTHASLACVTDERSHAGDGAGGGEADNPAPRRPRLLSVHQGA